VRDIKGGGECRLANTTEEKGDLVDRRIKPSPKTRWEDMKEEVDTTYEKLAAVSSRGRKKCHLSWEGRAIGGK